MRFVSIVGLALGIAAHSVLIVEPLTSGEPTPNSGSAKLAWPEPSLLKSGMLGRTPSGELVLAPLGEAAGADRSRESELQAGLGGVRLPASSALKPGQFRRNSAGHVVLGSVGTSEIKVCTPKAATEGCDYLSLSDALSRARPGDTIILSPGTYEQGAVIDVPAVTIRGEPGAHLNGGPVEGKAALVVKADNVTIDGIECSNIAVPDQNGACIRVEGDNLTVRNVYFHDNQEGILSGPGGGTLLVERSRFERNGFGGYAHGVYISKAVQTFIFRDNRILATKGEGHGFKSRAQRTIVENNVIASLDGDDSRAIDIPNGGEVIIRGNILQKGPNSVNWQMIGLALEGQLNTVNNTLIENNIFIFDLDIPYREWKGVIGGILGFDSVKKGKVLSSKSPGEVILRGNTIIGAHSIGADVTEQDNRVFRDRRSAGLEPYPVLPDVAP